MDLEADRAEYLRDRARDLLLSRDQGIDFVLKAHNLDALIFPSTRGAGIAARAGYPSIIVPAGFLPPVAPVMNPTPFGLTFTGTAWSEPTLLRVAYAFEQASRHRRPPASTPPLPKDCRGHCR